MGAGTRPGKPLTGVDAYNIYALTVEIGGMTPLELAARVTRQELQGFGQFSKAREREQEKRRKR